MFKINNQELKKIFLNIEQNKNKGIEILYNKYSKVIYGIAFSILKNKEDSEDIVQIVFTKIYELDNQKLPSNKEASWLYSLTKNETINFLKKKNNNICLDELYEIEDQNNEINKSIDKLWFNKVIKKLNANEQEIVSLKLLSNFSFDEISKLINQPVGTVKWRYYKSLHSIKLIIGNLSMFTITFLIGIKTILSTVKPQYNQQEFTQYMQNETISQNTIRKDENKYNNINSNDIQEQSKNSSNTLDNATLQDIYEKGSNTITENTIIQNETIQETVNSNTTNNTYIGAGFIGISILFLIISIIFFIKYQLKIRKKLSK